MESAAVLLDDHLARLELANAGPAERPAPVSAPLQLLAAVVESSRQAVLTREEDGHLRRLHYFRQVGTLSPFFDALERFYATVDRRKSVREPTTLVSVLWPDGSGDLDQPPAR